MMSDVKDRTWVDCMQGKWSYLCTITPALQKTFHHPANGRSFGVILKGFMCLLTNEAYEDKITSYFSLPFTFLSTGRGHLEKKRYSSLSDCLLHVHYTLGSQDDEFSEACERVISGCDYNDDDKLHFIDEETGAGDAETQILITCPSSQLPRDRPDCRSEI